MMVKGWERPTTAVLAFYLLLLALLEPTSWYNIPNRVFAAPLIVALAAVLLGAPIHALRSVVLWFYTALSLWLATCAAWSPYPQESWVATLFALKVFLVGIVVLQATTTLHYLKIALVAVVVGTTLLALGTLYVGLEPSLLAGVRSAGFARQENSLAQALFGGGVAALMLFPLVTRNQKRAIIIAAAIMLLALLMSGSRGSGIAVAALLGVFVLREVLPSPGKYYWRFVGVVLVGLVAWKIVDDILLGSPLVVRLQDTLGAGIEAVTADARWDIYQHAWRVFRQHPFMGVGLGNYQQFNPAYVYTHSAILELLVGSGALGAIIYYGALAYLVLQCARLSKAYKSHPDIRMFFNAALASVCAIAVQGLFSVAFQSKLYTALIFLISAAVRFLRVRASTAVVAAPQPLETLPQPALNH